MPLESPKRSTAARVAIGLLRLTWTLFVILVPLSGVWIASSLAAFGNGPVWVAVLSGALAFPLVPLGWEVLSEVLRRRAKARGPKRLSDLRTRGEGILSGDDRILTLWDRLVLRTLAVNILFVGGLLWAQPATVYEAVSARGDWMLDGVDAPWADAIRSRLHGAAERFEWLHERTHENKYEELVDEEFSSDEVEPEPVAEEETPVEVEDMAEAVAESRWKHWPQERTPHPLVVDMPEGSEASIESLAKYIADNEKDPWQRTKALHDWVATRVRYDYDNYLAGTIPPQDAQTTFDSRLSVCAGYANLLAALITEAGGRAVVVTGDARGSDGGLSGEGHAWNAVQLDGAWFLIDATWNAGSGDGKTWEFDYDTEYLFAPPEIIGLSHFPDEAAWQLRAEPLTRGEFLRQPRMRPRFYLRGFELISPRRSQVSVGDEVTIELRNSGEQWVMASAVAEDGTRHECEVKGRAEMDVTCELPQKGQYEVKLFSNEERYGSYQYLGALSVNASG